MDLIGHYRTREAILVQHNHHTTCLAKGQVVELVEIDIKHKQMWLNIDGYGLQVLDLNWKENLIRIF